MLWWIPSSSDGSRWRGVNLEHVPRRLQDSVPSPCQVNTCIRGWLSKQMSYFMQTSEEQLHRRGGVVRTLHSRIVTKSSPEDNLTCETKGILPHAEPRSHTLTWEVRERGV